MNIPSSSFYLLFDENVLMSSNILWSLGHFQDLCLLNQLFPCLFEVLPWASSCIDQCWLWGCSVCPWFSRILQRQVSKEVIDGGSVHVWLDLTSEMQTSFLFFLRILCSVFSFHALHILIPTDSTKIKWLFTDRQIGLMLQKQLHQAFQVPHDTIND